jgi:ABC-type amino acid transport substrate-binding protein
MRVLIAGLLATTLASAALAADEGACYVASTPVHADFALAQVAAAIAHKELTVVVIGSASSSLPGAEGATKAYPARLEETLKRRLPGVAVKVVAHTKARETAAEMSKSLQQVLVDDRPNLVVWQAGTVDAMLGIDPEEFQHALDQGVETLRDGKADAILMNMQYSPRTDSMIALGSYVDAMRLVALQREVPLFDRLAVMKNWNEMGVFDFYSANKRMDFAEKVHDCIGRLLGRLVVEGADLSQSVNTGSGPRTDTNNNRDTH